MPSWDCDPEATAAADAGGDDAGGVAGAAVDAVGDADAGEPLGTATLGLVDVVGVGVA